MLVVGELEVERVDTGTEAFRSCPPRPPVVVPAPPPVVVPAAPPVVPPVPEPVGVPVVAHPVSGLLASAHVPPPQTYQLPPASW